MQFILSESSTALMNHDDGSKKANSSEEEEACTAQRKACQKGHKHLQQEIPQQEGCRWPCDDCCADVALNNFIH